MSERARERAREKESQPRATNAAYNARLTRRARPTIRKNTCMSDERKREREIETRRRASVVAEERVKLYGRKIMSSTVDSHSRYLKEFRVDQCPLFIQRKCTQHRPFTCFNWHFMNQRRRRPVRKRDRTFNYSADNYCTKYDETTGICPDGDE